MHLRKELRPSIRRHVQMAGQERLCLEDIAVFIVIRGRQSREALPDERRRRHRQGEQSECKDPDPTAGAFGNGDMVLGGWLWSHGTAPSAYDPPKNGAGNQCDYCPERAARWCR